MGFRRSSVVFVFLVGAIGAYPLQRASAQGTPFTRQIQQLSPVYDNASLIKVARNEKPAFLGASPAPGAPPANATLSPNGQAAGTANGESFPRPVPSGKAVGYGDTAAIAEIVASKAIWGAPAWVGMQAVGTLTFADDQSQVPVTLSMLPGNRVKFDLELRQGHDISIVNGKHGWNQRAPGKPIPMFSEEVAAGLFPIDLPLRATQASTLYSIIDYGNVTVNGKSLHRVAVENHIPAQSSFPERHNTVAVVDCYFDPATHFLENTVSLVPAPNNSTVKLLRVNSYSGYKAAGTLLLPTGISESINGQSLWTMSLTSIDLNNLATSATFFPSK